MKLATSLAVLSFAAVASAAPSKSECVDADTWGQTHRMHGRLHAARADFRICMNPSCPEIVRANCAMRIEEVDRAMPTVILEAPVDLATAKITMDGVPLTVSANPIEVEPGAHHFVVRVGDLAVTRDVVVSEGEKRRSIVFDRPTAPVAPPPAQRAAWLTPLRGVGIVSAALGLVSLGFGAAFGIAAFDAWSSAKAECFDAAQCDTASAVRDRQRTLDFATVSDVTFVVGGVLAAGGLTLIVLGGRAQPIIARDAVGVAFSRSF